MCGINSGHTCGKPKQAGGWTPSAGRPVVGRRGADKIDGRRCMPARQADRRTDRTALSGTIGRCEWPAARPPSADLQPARGTPRHLTRRGRASIDGTGPPTPVTDDGRNSGDRAAASPTGGQLRRLPRPAGSAAASPRLACSGAASPGSVTASPTGDRLRTEAKAGAAGVIRARRMTC